MFISISSINARLIGIANSPVKILNEKIISHINLIVPEGYINGKLIIESK